MYQRIFTTGKDAAHQRTRKCSSQTSCKDLQRVQMFEHLQELYLFGQHFTETRAVFQQTGSKYLPHCVPLVSHSAKHLLRQLSVALA